MYAISAVSWFCDHRACISLGRISADTGCAGCRRVGRTVQCEEHTHQTSTQNNTHDKDSQYTYGLSCHAGPEQNASGPRVDYRAQPSWKTRACGRTPHVDTIILFLVLFPLLLWPFWSTPPLRWITSRWSKVPSCVRVLHIKPFSLPVDIQRTHCPCRFFLLEIQVMWLKKHDTWTLRCNAVSIRSKNCNNNRVFAKVRF